jgi:hypothetical protein
MDVMTELPDDLAKAMGALDARAARAAARVDAERVAARVLERLRSEPDVVGPLRPWRVLRIAAALALLVTGGVVVRRVMRDDAVTVVRAALPVDVPESLSTRQVEAVFEAVAAVPSDTAVIMTSAAVSVEDLNEAELRALLQAMQTESEGAL